MIKLIECPRDAIQGIKHFISTEKKAAYIHQLLHAGFDTIDFGSFVSPKAVPQMADTAEVLNLLYPEKNAAKLLAIVVNEKGARDACAQEKITCLGFPFSVSETFSKRNNGATIEESFSRVKNIQELCLAHKKQLVIYLSMGFGNPYGDAWSAQLVLKWINRLSELGIHIFSIADTTSSALPEIISDLFGLLIPTYPNLEFGAHLHTRPVGSLAKVKAAYKAGVRRFDSTVLGYGGCPMAGDELVGNLATETLYRFMKEKDKTVRFTEEKLQQLQKAFQELIA